MFRPYSLEFVFNALAEGFPWNFVMVLGLKERKSQYLTSPHRNVTNTAADPRARGGPRLGPLDVQKLKGFQLQGALTPV